MTPAAALALVRRMRRRLEGLRVLRSIARGALALAAAALLVVLAGKALGSNLAWAFWLPAAGAVAGLGAAATRRGIEPVAAALFLDARCATGERFATICAHPDRPGAARWASELGDRARVPSLPWPREASILPVALFLLLAASLIPAAGAEEPAIEFARGEASESAASDASPDDAAPDVDAAAATLAGPASIGPERKRELERAIENAFARPEDRARARTELERAAGGDAAARRKLGDALLRGAGALGGEEGERAGGDEPVAARDAARWASPYPDDVEFLRAYRVAKARLLREER